MRLNRAARGNMMLDLILIQDKASGIKLFEFQGPHALIDSEHALIFSGFLSAIQCITTELNMGDLSQISTDSHHCLIHNQGVVHVIVIVDSSDNMIAWRHKASIIGRKFVNQCIKDNFCSSDMSTYTPFTATLKEILEKL